MNIIIENKLAPAIKDFVALGLYFWSGVKGHRKLFDDFIQGFGLYLKENFPSLEFSEDAYLKINADNNWITIHAQNFFEDDEDTQLSYLRSNGYEVEFNEEGDEEYTWEDNFETEYGEVPHLQCVEILEEAFSIRFNGSYAKKETDLSTLDNPFPADALHWKGELGSLLQGSMSVGTSVVGRLAFRISKVEQQFVASLFEHMLDEIIVERQEVSQ